MVTPTTREQPYLTREEEPATPIPSGNVAAAPLATRPKRPCGPASWPGMLVRVLLLAALLLTAPARAAITCSALQVYCSGTIAATTWTEFILPAGTAYVMIEVSGAAYVDGPGGGYTDGAARSSGGRSSTSGETIGMPIRVAIGTTSIYVAGNGASRTVTIYVAGPEAR